MRLEETRQILSVPLALSVAVVVGLAGAGCGPDSSEVVRRSTSGITAGYADDSDEAAVWIVAKVGGATGFCSGVVVSPHVVLTAGHCSSIEAAYSIFLGADYNDPATKTLPESYVPVIEHHPHPRFDANLNANDIGVLVTESAIPRAAAAINRAPLVDGDVGVLVRIVGYGQTEGGMNRTYGRRYAADTTLAAFDITGLAVDGLPNICFFDSGGPTFMTRDGAEVVVGVHSVLESQDCASRGWDTRVDVYAEFVDQYIDGVDPIVDAGSPEEEDAGDAGSAEPGEADAGSPAPVDAGQAQDASRADTNPSSCSVGLGRPAWSYPFLVALVAAMRWLRRRSGRARSSRRGRPEIEGRHHDRLTGCEVRDGLVGSFGGDASRCSPPGSPRS